MESDGDDEYPEDNEIDIIDVFLQNFKDYTTFYVIPEFGARITHEKIYEFVQKNK